MSNGNLGNVFDSLGEYHKAKEYEKKADKSTLFSLFLPLSLSLSVYAGMLGSLQLRFWG